jgi:hypothetical protein
VSSHAVELLLAAFRLNLGTLGHVRVQCPSERGCGTTRHNNGPLEVVNKLAWRSQEPCPSTNAGTVLACEITCMCRCESVELVLRECASYAFDVKFVPISVLYGTPPSLPVPPVH